MTTLITSLSRALALAMLATLTLGACTDTEERKDGYAGEYCAGSDLDCRDDHVCENFTCVRVLTNVSLACESSCDRLVTQCGRTETSAGCGSQGSYRCCVTACTNTLRSWTEAAVEVFQTCSVGLTCEEAVQVNAPSLCYQQIPLPEARKAVCDTIILRANQVSGQIAVIDTIRNMCYILARTSPDELFVATQNCAASDLTADEFVDCINTTQDRGGAPGQDAALVNERGDEMLSPPSHNDMAP